MDAKRTLRVALFLWLGAVLSIAGCRSALSPIEERYAEFASVYSALEPNHGQDPLDEVFVDLRGTPGFGIAAQELPFPPDKIWFAFREELGRVTRRAFHRGLRFEEDHTSWRLATFYYCSYWEPRYAYFDRLFFKLSPTEYGTTVVRLGLQRYVVRGDLMYETEDAGIFKLSLVDFDPTASPPHPSLDLEISPVADWNAHRLAVTALTQLLEEIDSRTPPAELSARVHNLRERHRVQRESPARLAVTAAFDDHAALLPNESVDPGETAEVRLTVTNLGLGTAFDVKIAASGGVERLRMPSTLPLSEIGPGETVQLPVSLVAPLDLQPGFWEITLQATERRGYDSDPLELVLPVAPLVAPDLRIVTARIDQRTGDDGDDDLGSGETVELAVVVENRGRGPAAGVDLLSSSAAPGLSIEGERLELGRIDAGGSVQARIPVSLAPTAGDEPVEILLVAVDGRGEEVGKAERRVSLPVLRRRPLIEISHRLYDGDSAHSSGDRDGVVQNGEAPELELRIANRGRLSADAVEVELQAFPAEMAVAPGRLEIGSLPALTEGEARTVRLTLPRSLDHVGPLRLTLVVRQRHFAPQRRTIELPFARRTPDLRVGPRLLAGLLPGRIEARTLLIQNVGNLEARGVRTTVRTADPGLELLDHAGAPAPELSVERAELRTADAALEVPVRLIAKGQATGVGLLTVEVRQDDFPPVVATVEVPIEARVTQRVEIAPLPERPEPPTEGAVEDRTPPVVLIIEPGDVASQESASFTVRSAQVRVRGTASDASGIYRVAVGESPVTVDAHGTFTAWVKLRFGRNDLRVAAEDVHGNEGAVRFTIERLGDAGRPRIDRALLFATDRYDHWSALSNPVADARELAATLEASYGFTVEVVANPTRVDVLRTLRRYAEMEPGPEDQLLVFFAGHGHFDERFDEGYLVTTESLRRDELGTSYLAFSQLANLLDGLPHRHLLVVLDACFGGAFDQRLSRARGPAEEPGSWTRAWVAEKLRPLSRLYLAAGELERVDDGPAGGNSPFMRRFLGALHQGTRGARPLTSRELFVLMDRPAPLAPEPRAGEFGDHEPQGDFLFIPASR